MPNAATARDSRGGVSGSGASDCERLPGFNPTDSVNVKGLAMKKYLLPAIFALSVSSAPAFAADLQKMYTKAPPAPAFNPWDLAFGGALATDYNFRGISQSALGPSVSAYFEGRFNQTKDIQWYAGIAGASVKLPTDPSAEIDFYGGVRLTFDKFGLDLGLMYYAYPSERQIDGLAAGSAAQIAVPNGNTTLNNSDFLEFYAKGTYTFNDNFAVGANVFYTDDYLNTGAQGTFFSGTAKYTGTASPSGWNWYVSGELGYYDLGTTKFDQIAFPVPQGWDLPSYATWNAGIGFTYKVVTLDLRYYDTDLSKEECNVLTADPGATSTGNAISITNPNGLQSKWCGAAFIGKLSFDMTLNNNIK